MFAESLLESSDGVKTRLHWTTLVSLSLEGLVIGLLVVLPLLENQAEPRLVWTVTTSVPPPPRSTPNPGHSGGGRRSPGAISLPWAQPASIPRMTDRTPDGRDSGADVTGPGLLVGLPNGVAHATGPLLELPALPPRPAPPSALPRTSIVAEGNVIYRVSPVYPPIARQIGAQGSVVLQSIISKESTVESLRVVSSAHPLLDRAAIEAVSQWRFRPSRLNGEAVEVEAQITVNFVISH